MSYRGAALQAALHGHLSNLPTLSGVPVVDVLPSGPVPVTYVLVGPEEVRDASDGSGRGAEHRVTISVISEASGFLAAKTIASDMGDALDEADLVLSGGRVVSIRFQRAVARRLEAGAARRIDLTFRVRIEA